ncbi:MAG: PQQ-binding-like beta-propeller repeat protein [Methanoregula sp.]|nr:PQQ-binding-like beta-propeller repeat protein [Methanoregula sp.]
MPAVSAIEPLWTHDASTSGELSGVVISADGSTIVAGGDQLVSLSRDGKKRWTGWSGNRLVISSDGNYLLTTRDQTIRMIDSSGTMLWDESLGVPVSDIDMVPNASLVIAGGGSRVRVMEGSGAAIRYNHTIYISHLRLLSGGDQVVFTSKIGVQRSNLTLLMEWEDTNMTQDLVEVPADGSFFVTVTNNRVRKYTAEGDLKWDRKLPGGNALAFALSRDGSTIVVGRDDNTITALDSKGNELFSDRAGHWITSVAVSDDGNTIACGSIDKTLLVYERDGTKLGSFAAANPIKARSVAVSADGSLIAATDGSTVYGFSRDQFTRLPAPAPSPMVVQDETTVPPPSATATAAPPPPAPSATATPKAALPLSVTLLAPGILLLLRPRDS